MKNRGLSPVATLLLYCFLLIDGRRAKPTLKKQRFYLGVALAYNLQDVSIDAKAIETLFISI